MLEAESRGVVVRVSDLERRVLEQGDELVCLKATLAEALRRISLLEGTKLAHQVNSMPTTPVRNGVSKENRLRPQRDSPTRLVFYKQSVYFGILHTGHYFIAQHGDLAYCKR